MDRTITVSDEVYRKLSREQGDRSLSEVIEEHLAATYRLSDVTGQGILDESTVEAVNRDVERLSERTGSGLSGDVR